MHRRQVPAAPRGASLAALAAALYLMVAMRPAFADAPARSERVTEPVTERVTKHMTERVTQRVTERFWYRTPEAEQVALSEQILDQLADLGNQLGYHLDVLSLEMIALHVDGRRRRVLVGLGAGEARYLSFRWGSELHFIGGLARVTTRVDLAVAGRTLHLQLPEVELVPASYRGERGVEVRLPLFERTF